MSRLAQAGSQISFPAEYVYKSMRYPPILYPSESPKTWSKRAKAILMNLILGQLGHLSDTREYWLTYSKIGDTPTIGAGFWAEEWNQSPHERWTKQPQKMPPWLPTPLNDLAEGLRNVLGDCINLSGYSELSFVQGLRLEKKESMSTIRAVAMSGLLYF